MTLHRIGAAIRHPAFMRRAILLKFIASGGGTFCPHILSMINSKSPDIVLFMTRRMAREVYLFNGTGITAEENMFMGGASSVLLGVTTIVPAIGVRTRQDGCFLSLVKNDGTKNLTVKDEDSVFRHRWCDEFIS